jgi:putative tricarboxylic transport membrane protein
MRLTQDIVSGIATIGLAIGTLFALSKIPQTSYQAIAPDLFPRLCAYGLILGGLVLIGRGVVRGGDAVSLPPLRPFLAVVAGVVAFGLIAPRAGYAPAGLLTLVISGLGSSDLKIRQLIVVAAGLIVFSVVLFSYVLKLPLPVLVLPGYRF